MAQKAQAVLKEVGSLVQDSVSEAMQVVRSAETVAPEVQEMKAGDSLLSAMREAATALSFVGEQLEEAGSIVASLGKRLKEQVERNARGVEDEVPSDSGAG